MCNYEEKEITEKEIVDKFIEDLKAIPLFLWDCPEFKFQVEEVIKNVSEVVKKKIKDETSYYLKYNK